ncbi:hypothetical protein K745_gp45 [Haloarcula hispanica virus PH1]|uniref:Uncharacterized protein n=1 Tax=Haloarcula hispanica virus PH1 TaxID=1282967 RepID=M4JGG7_9VIRU|nr:hypothetical protein K745_gp45 [Haloarcula hispanica virus PH1]AGC65570.1 hypothetical protein HhPH1_gp45 [Haloarcula hispanica virus PH1]
MTGDSNPTRTLTTYVGAGCSCTVALDLYMVRDAGMSPEAWAAIRGRSVRAVTQSLDSAADTFPGLDLDALTGGDA